MTFTLRRIVWPDGSSRPDDFNIMQDGDVVGPALPHERSQPGAVALDSLLVHAGGRTVALLTPSMMHSAPHGRRGCPQVDCGGLCASSEATCDANSRHDRASSKYVAFTSRSTVAEARRSHSAALSKQPLTVGTAITLPFIS
jgi:hypothetical protein